MKAKQVMEKYKITRNTLANWVKKGWIKTEKMPSAGESINFDKISDDLEMIDKYLSLEYDKNIEMKYITFHLKSFEGRYWRHDCTYSSLKSAKEDSGSYKSGVTDTISIKYNYTEK